MTTLLMLAVAAPLAAAQPGGGGACTPLTPMGTRMLPDDKTAAACAALAANATGGAGLGQCRSRCGVEAAASPTGSRLCCSRQCCGLEPEAPHAPVAGHCNLKQSSLVSGGVGVRVHRRETGRGPEHCEH